MSAVNILKIQTQRLLDHRMADLRHRTFRISHGFHLAVIRGRVFIVADG